MTPFAFVIHPFEPKDAAKKYPLLRYFPDTVIEHFLRYKKPMLVSEIKGIVSSTGATTEGWFIGCPLTPEQMTRKVPTEEVYDKIVQCTELAHSLGAKLIGLGAFTSVVGDGGITVAKRSPIPVTTGNSYTVATAIEGTLHACDLLEVDRPRSTLAVVGATGSIGKTCATILAPQFEHTLVVGRDLARTEQLAATLPHGEATTSLDRLREADVIITVTSAETAVIEPEHLRQGAIICDVARPRDVSVRVAKTRKDILIIEGGVVKVPGNPEFGIDFGFPRGTAYACMSETMMLALEDRAECFTLGKDVSVEQVEETQRLAAKHGFELAGFRSFEREVGADQIEFVRQVRRDRLSAYPA
ncbi:MAG: Aminotransferase PigE [Fimbriimonadaceae bacterium]|nr:Aminotransferase PigE [Fimbriimonadaceae bacterium]